MINRQNILKRLLLSITIVVVSLASGFAKATPFDDEQARFKKQTGGFANCELDGIYVKPEPGTIANSNCVMKAYGYFANAGYRWMSYIENYKKAYVNLEMNSGTSNLCLTVYELSIPYDVKKSEGRSVVQDDCDSNKLTSKNMNRWDPHWQGGNEYVFESKVSPGYCLAVINGETALDRCVLSRPDSSSNDWELWLRQMYYLEWVDVWDKYSDENPPPLISDGNDPDNTHVYYFGQKTNSTYLIQQGGAVGMTLKSGSSDDKASIKVSFGRK